MVNRISVRFCVLALAAFAAGSGVALAEEAKPEAKKQTYKIVKRDGVELYCRSEPVTGSRTQKKETCLTQEQVDAERARGVNIVTGR